MSDRANNLIRALAGVVQSHQTYYFRDASQDGFQIFLSPVDATDLYQPLPGEFKPAHEFKDGDTGRLFGLPFVIDEKLPPGVWFLGYRVTDE